MGKLGRRTQCCLRLLAAFWSTVVIGGVAIGLSVQKECSVDKLACSENSALVIVLDTTSSAKLDRQTAIEYGMNSLTEQINYLLLLASAVVALIVKPIVDRRNEVDAPAFSEFDFVVILNTAVAASASMFFGVFSLQYVVTLSVDDCLLLSGAIGVFALMQILAFGLCMGSLALLVVRSAYGRVAAIDLRVE